MSGIRFLNEKHKLGNKREREQGRETQTDERKQKDGEDLVDREIK